MAETLYERFTTVGYYCSTYTVDYTNRPAYLSTPIEIGKTGINEDFVLTRVGLYLNKAGSPTGDLTIEIRENVDGLPGQLRAIGTISMSSITTAQWYYCTNFTGNLLMEASGKYTIVINHISTATATDNIEWNGNSGYAVGQYCYLSDDNTATWVKVSEAYELPLNSFAFQIFGSKYEGTLCSYNDVVLKAGKGANSVALSVTNVGNYVLMAESILNSRTKTDWTNIYSTLSKNKKYILNEIVSNLAAIKVINYDMSGYSSRLEAESMQNTLRKEAEKYIKELKEEDIKTFVKDE